MVLIIETIVEVLKACVSPVALFILALMILIVYIFKAGTNYLNIKRFSKIIYRYFLMQENTCGYSGECLCFYPPHWCRSLRSQVN